ncbi:MAG: nitroreductase family protein [Candidatus Competibacterales bacterium]|nr:nitroreductase family protein [Candidatus Competibacterales bacterium]
MTISDTIDTSISPELLSRWSPYGFDPERSVNADDLRALFEAARSAASSYNAQPWRYIVGVRERDPETWDRVRQTLVPANEAWARQAPVLALGLIQPNFEHNGKPNVAAPHDLGAASASLTFEATRRGLLVHQMIGFDAAAASEAFELAELQPFTAIAIGYQGQAPSAELAERDSARKPRKPLSELIVAGQL